MITMSKDWSVFVALEIRSITTNTGTTNHLRSEPRGMGWPDFLLPLMAFFYGSFIFIVSLFDDDYEPEWPITLTGEIERSSE